MEILKNGHLPVMLHSSAVPSLTPGPVQRLKFSLLFYLSLMIIRKMREWRSTLTWKKLEERLKYCQKSIRTR